MSAGKHVNGICTLITVLTLLLTAVFINGRALGITVLADGDSGDGYFTENDLDGEWDHAGAWQIRLAGDGAEISGGAYFEDGCVHIISAGRYVVSGTLREGGIIVEAPEGGKVWLELQGIDVTNPEGAAIDVEQAEKVFLTLAAGSENRIASEAFTDTASGVDGALYARDDVTVNGSGTLAVSSAGHGIVCNDDLVITGGSITVTAKEDGLHANDSVRICGAEVEIQAGDDGVTVSNDAGTGYFYMESGSLSIPACYEGVEGQQITVAGGDIDIAPTDDGLNVSQTGAALTVTGGRIRVVNPSGRDADGFDSNGSIYISGGSVLISVSQSGGSAALDAGTESGGECIVSGGTVVAAGSAAMAEGFDQSSPQGFVMMSAEGQEGSRVRLMDKEGKSLLDETIPCAFSSLILSCPELTVGDKVTVEVDGSASQVEVDNSGSSGSAFGRMGGGRGGIRAAMGSADALPAGDGGNMPDLPERGDLQLPEGEALPGDGDLQRPDGGAFFPADGESGQDLPERGNFQLPEGEASQIPMDRAGFRGQRQQPWQQETLAADGQQALAPDPSALVLTALSAAVLGAGILFAVKVKH